MRRILLVLALIAVTAGTAAAASHPPAIAVGWLVGGTEGQEIDLYVNVSPSAHKAVPLPLAARAFAGPDGRFVLRTSGTAAMRRLALHNGGWVNLGIFSHRGKKQWQWYFSVHLVKGRWIGEYGPMIGLHVHPWK